MASKDTAVSKLSHPHALARTNEPGFTSAAKTKGMAVLDELPKQRRLLFIPLPETAVEPAEETGWRTGRLKKLCWRHAVIGVSFPALVVTPTTLASLYMTFVAADQYYSATSFAVRNVGRRVSSDFLGMFTQATDGSTVSDSYIIMDYIQSERIVVAADCKFMLESVYATRGLDYFFGIGSKLPIEDKLAYWRNMVRVNFDQATGIMQVTVKAFSPQQAQALGEFIVGQRGSLVNSLSLSVRNDVLRAARNEVQGGEARLSRARAVLRDYRDKAQEISPEEGAKLAIQLIASLEQQLTQLNTDLGTVKGQVSEGTPRVHVLKARIKSVEQQLAVERQRLGTGGRKTAANDEGAADVAGRIAEFEELETEREFAERAFTAALTSLEKARIDANNRQRYLALFIAPTLSEQAQYPARTLDAFLVAIGLLFAWGIGVMSWYNIRYRSQWQAGA
ncbi:RkpR, polysaccharide export protein [Ensifer sp. ENS07]|uniref:RkpR, polysaccharide export protein n=1 Tax=Ensifer sp. ENS07 TaxID=2769274 RepID=UPI0017812002|nr:RkpR, polysaccharide export protein [Ensifer sp. ENS07]